MKLALHRSITFWSGLLVMIFLVWAWCNSERQSTTVRSGAVMLRSAWSGLAIDWPESGTTMFGPWYFHKPLKALDRHLLGTFTAPAFLRADDVTPEERRDLLDREINRIRASGPFPMTRLDQLKLSLTGERAWILFLPYWLLILITAVPWGGLLLWRRKRRMKSMTNAESPNAE